MAGVCKEKPNIGTVRMYYACEYVTMPYIDTAQRIKERKQS